MSGGSYDYLCFKNSDEVLNELEQLRNMRDRLNGLGYTDIAQATQSVIGLIEQYRTIMDDKIERIQDIWKAIEWADSGDTSESEIKEAVEKYRTLSKETP